MNAINEPNQLPATRHTPPSVELLRCSFYGKRRTDVRSIVGGTIAGIAVCDQCVELCDEIIAEQPSPACGEDPPASAIEQPRN